MKQKNAAISIRFILATFFFISAPTLVWALSGRDYEEVGYDDLLNELTVKKQKLQQKNSPSGNPLRHVGIGFANSFSTISNRKSSTNLHASGIQLSAGTDLISPEWYAEGVFRNYSPSTNYNEDSSLRELEGKIGYTNNLENIWHYSISTGVSNRFLRYTNNQRGISINESAPSLVIATSLFAQVHKNLSIGAEISGRTSMVNTSAEQNSFDFALRLNTSL